jgi:Zn finger protein HypA/HybF involved in hydrogenase expression
MFIISRDGWVLASTRTVSLQCDNCQNTGEHVVWVHPGGLQLGFMLMKKCISTNKKYYLMCPTCSNATRELTKYEALRYKI